MSAEEVIQYYTNQNYRPQDIQKALKEMEKTLAATSALSKSTAK